MLRQQQPDWECCPWPEFPLARDLCQKLLCFKVNDRIFSAKEALAHPWLNGEASPKSGSSNAASKAPSGPTSPNTAAPMPPKTSAVASPKPSDCVQNLIGQ